MLQRKAISVLLCCLPLAILVCLSIRQDYDILSYTLDDPYIHLELAKNIFNGNYGINTHEFSSPSSSIIWPFILAPFSIFDWYIYAPLLLNAVFLGLTIAILLNHVLGDIEPYLIRILTVTSIAFSLNLYGLVMTGMEHSLQVLCSSIIAFGLINRDFRHSQALLFYFALVIAPLVRYESLALTVPVLFYLISFRQDRKLAFLSGGVLLFLIGIFSLFLFLNSGYFFPSSVMIKQSVTSDANAMSIVTKLINNIQSQMSQYGWLIAIFLYVLIKSRVEKKLLVTCASITFLYLALGKYGWFGRYEVFFVMFVTVLLFSITLGKFQAAKFVVVVDKKFLAICAAITFFYLALGWYERFGHHRDFFVMLVAVLLFFITREKFKARNSVVVITALLMPLAFGSLVNSTISTPRASSNIYNQQYLTSIFVKDLNEPIAVNDLGLISLNSDRTIVDLWGLGNLEAMTARKYKEPSYVNQLMSKNDARFAVIYREWFSKEQLENLVFVGSLTLNERRITPAVDTVSFFANSIESAEELKIELRKFDFRDNTLFVVETVE